MDKILYIHRTRCAGVEKVHINGIVEAFNQVGFYTEFVSPDSAEQKQSCITKSAVSSNQNSRLYDFFAKHAPEIFFEFAELIYNLKGIVQAAKKIKGSKYHFVYERYAIFSVIGAWISKKYRIPLIVEVNYTSQSPLVRKRNTLMAPLARYVDNIIFRQAALLLPVSSYLKKHLVTHYNVSEQKIIVLPNAADPAIFNPEIISPIYATKINGRQKTIGFIGGFYPWHGVHLLVDAFKIVSLDIRNAHLLLIGDGPEKKNIEAKIKSLNLTSAVTLPGSIPHRDILPWLASFDIGVMPDSNEYGSPMKIFEYMAMSKPVVVPDYEPLRDAVDHGVEGFIFPPKDIEAMAGYLKQLITDEVCCRDMARAARKRILKRHNWASNVQQVLSFFD